MPNTFLDSTALNPKRIGAILCCYFILLCFNAYVFGANDMVEVLPYASYLNDLTLYPEDFFIQHIVHDLPNERFLIAFLLSLGGIHVALWAGILHLGCAFFLLWGLFRIGKRYIDSDEFVWLAILLCLVPFYGINLGGNEVYINMFTSSTLAKAIGVWGIVFFLEDKYWRSFILVSCASFAQPIVGMQLFLLLSGILILGRFLGRIQLPWTHLIAMFLFFILTGGLWIIFLKLNFDKGAVSADLFFEIMEFRTPHHFFPSYYPLKSYLLLLPLFLFAWFFYGEHSWKLSLFFTLTILGLIVFVVGVEYLGIPIVLTAQWFKTTIWLKVFSFFSLLYFVEKHLPEKLSLLWDKLAGTGLAITALICIGLMIQPISFLAAKEYHFFFTKNQNSEIDIALQAKEKTNKDALFLTPADNTSFKYYSQRGAYVDYKAVLHRGDVMPVWYDRIQEVYKIDLTTRRAGKDNIAEANAHFFKLNEASLLKIGTKSISHILTEPSHQLDFPIVAENEDFRIYKIR